MACTGRYGTTTKACQRIRASSTTRTSSLGYHGCDRSKSAMSPVPSTKTSRAKFSNATTSTPHPTRTLPPLAPRMELRKSTRTIVLYLLFTYHDGVLMFAPCCATGGCTPRRQRSTGAVTGVGCLSMEVGATTKICPERKRSPRSSCSFSKSACGWTEEPGPCFWISPSTTGTSTCFVLSGKKQKHSFAAIC